MKKILIVSLFFTLTACKEAYLERSSLVAVTSASFWQNEEEAKLGVNAIYDALQDRPQYSGTLNVTNAAGFPMYDCFGDNAFNNYRYEGPGDYMVRNMDPSKGFFNGLWNSSYRGIARANLALENIEKIPLSKISPETKKSLLAQALFLRSLFYMNLAIYFEDVPLILKVQSLDEAYVPKNTYAEVSDQVIRDLKSAANDLPVSYPSNEFGYATKGAALGLLARFELYNKNYQGVLDATQQMLSLGYALNSNYAQLFTESGELSREIVFSVRFFQDAISNNGELFSATFEGIPRVNEQPMRNLVRDYYCTDGRPITTSPLYNAANERANRDPRLLASVYFRNDVWLTSPLRTFAGNTATGYGRKKYIRNGPSSTGIRPFSPGGQDFIVIRWADVLLMRAEALIELNRSAEAVSLIDQVRARVSMPSIAQVEGANNAVLTQADYRNILRHERRVELALEGLRFFDLKRWGEMQQAIARAAADNVAGYAPLYEGKKSEIFAIPQTELEANEFLVQHPAWQ